MMTHFVSERFNVAWFKLAEFVHRKEKERALAMYRLLFHSLSDEALLSQLEGDLLLAFKDDKAFEVYKRAALQYAESGRLLAAVLVYEHIAKLSPAPLDALENIVELYTSLGYASKKARAEKRLAALCKSFSFLHLSNTDII